MLDTCALSELRACRLAGLSRDAFRRPPGQVPATQALSARIIELAQARRRFGYRRLHDLLRLEYPSVNPKKVYRLYREANLAVCHRKKIRDLPGVASLTITADNAPRRGCRHRSTPPGGTGCAPARCRGHAGGWCR